jgi:hypothetical protein
MRLKASWQSERLLGKASFAVAIVVAAGLTGTAHAQYQNNSTLPDFYTRPVVSPYLDMLNPGLGPSFLRYNSVRQKQATLNNERQTQTNYQKQQTQFVDRKRQYEEDQRAAEAKRKSQGEVEDPRVGSPRHRSPFYQPAADRNSGNSYNIRPTGHTVRYGDRRVDHGSRRRSQGQ